MREVFSPSLDMSHLNLGLNELLHSFPEGGNSGTRGFEEGQRKPEDAPLRCVVLGPALPSVLPMPSPSHSHAGPRLTPAAALLHHVISQLAVSPISPLTSQL